MWRKFFFLLVTYLMVYGLRMVNSVVNFSFRWIQWIHWKIKITFDILKREIRRFDELCKGRVYSVGVSVFVQIEMAQIGPTSTCKQRVYLVLKMIITYAKLIDVNVCETCLSQKADKLIDLTLRSFGKVFTTSTCIRSTWDSNNIF